MLHLNTYVQEGSKPLLKPPAGEDTAAPTTITAGSWAPPVQPATCSPCCMAQPCTVAWRDTTSPAVAANQIKSAAYCWHNGSQQCGANTPSPAVAFNPARWSPCMGVACSQPAPAQPCVPRANPPCADIAAQTSCIATSHLNVQTRLRASQAQAQTSKPTSQLYPQTQMLPSGSLMYMMPDSKPACGKHAH